MLPGSGRSDVGSAPAVQGQRLVMRDNVHLFDPGAEHHEVLATEGTSATSPGNPFFPPSASCWPYAPRGCMDHCFTAISPPEDGPCFLKCLCHCMASSGKQQGSAVKLCSQVRTPDHVTAGAWARPCVLSWVYKRRSTRHRHRVRARDPRGPFRHVAARADGQGAGPQNRHPAGGCAGHAPRSVLAHGVA